MMPFEYWLLLAAFLGILLLTVKPVGSYLAGLLDGSGRVVKLGKKDRTTWETRTNQDGIAKIPEVPQGTLLVQVIAKGYQTVGKNYEVNQDDQTIEIKLNPPQPQHSAHQ